jgi:chromosome segregation ATPase
MRRLPLLVIGLALPVLCGCANTPQMRSLAGQLGSYADAHRARNEDARARYDALNADIERERAQLDEDTAALRRRMAHLTRAARIDRTTIATAEASSPEDIVASLKAATTSIPPVEAGNLSARLEAATQVTAQMAVKPKRLAQIREVAGIYREIHKQLESLQGAADEGARTAKPKAAAKGSLAAKAVGK